MSQFSSQAEGLKLPAAFVEMQLASITTFNLRFSHHVMKINENLHSFVNAMEELSEGIDDATAQREKRIRAEFSRRFTRDYLYPIQLKVNELENEYLTFISNRNCKIAQSMILRTLVLTLLKKLSSCTQAYLQFLRKNKSKVFVKLKEILNLISHSFEIIKSIVDHRILNNNDVEKLCSVISNSANDQKQRILNSQFNYDENISKKNNVTKENVAKKPILKKISHRKNCRSKVSLEKPSRIKKRQDLENVQSCDNHSCKDIKNATFTVISHSSASKEDEAKNIKNYSSDMKDTANINSVSLHNCISEACSRISELILDELLTDVVVDMSDCIRELVSEAFDLEFKNNY